MSCPLPSGSQCISSVGGSAIIPTRRMPPLRGVSPAPPKAVSTPSASTNPRLQGMTYRPRGVCVGSIGGPPRLNFPFPLLYLSALPASSVRSHSSSLAVLAFGELSLMRLPVACQGCPGGRGPVSGLRHHLRARRALPLPSGEGWGEGKNFRLDRLPSAHYHRRTRNCMSHHGEVRAHPYWVTPARDSRRAATIA